jgi:hypothetical protein
VRVDVQCDAHGGVPQHFRDYLRRDVLREQQRGAGMPEVVEAYRAEPGTPQERLEGAVSQVGGVDKRARRRGEDETARLVERAHAFHLLKLAREMSPERLYRSGGEPDGSPALLGLRLTEDIAFVRAG